MTKKEFLDDFAEDLKVVLQDVYTKNTIGEEVGVTVYKNRLPVVTEDEEDESQYFPMPRPMKRSHGSRESMFFWEFMTMT